MNKAYQVRVTAYSVFEAPAKTSRLKLKELALSALEDSLQSDPSEQEGGLDLNSIEITEISSLQDLHESCQNIWIEQAEGPVKDFIAKKHDPEYATFLRLKKKFENE